jgi:hypothetical protein
MFCTCSRTRSISVFSSTTWCAIGASALFDPIVGDARSH